MSVFRIDSGLKQVRIMFPCLISVYMDAVVKEVKVGMGRRGVIFQKEGREYRLPGILHADDGFVW